MKVLIATDSFKGSASSAEAGEALKRGIERVGAGDVVDLCPVADGGEGTTEAFSFLPGAEKKKVAVSGPGGHPVEGEYVLHKDRMIFETATAAGISLLEKGADPFRSSTKGVGEMIRIGLDRGIRIFFIGLGGSGTNDGGIGMLQALGLKFYDDSDREMKIENLRDIGKIKRIDPSRMDPRLRESEFYVLCDVTNPLCGEKGASMVFGPQKGATARETEELDNLLKRFSEKTKEVLPCDPDSPGSGAAGGLGFALMTYLGGRYVSGGSFLLKETGVTEKMGKADLVITGEGAMDDQTLGGKLPAVIAEEAKKRCLPVIAFCGAFKGELSRFHNAGIDAVFSVQREIVDPKRGMSKEYTLKSLEMTAEEVFRVLHMKA